MRRVIGFALFCIAVGMMIMLLLPADFLGVVLIGIFLLMGYNLFC